VIPITSPILEARQGALVRGKDNHHEDDHSGASIVPFRVDGLCLDLGTCLRTPPCNLAPGGSLTSSPHLVGAAAAPLVEGAPVITPRIAMGDRAPGLAFKLLVTTLMVVPGASNALWPHPRFLPGGATRQRQPDDRQ
jgi:hypothetical protein